MVEARFGQEEVTRSRGDHSEIRETIKNSIGRGGSRAVFGENGLVFYVSNDACLSCASVMP